ncbi:MAG TPA: hypothetical protein VGG10_10815 [Rhizomicrobium sp.]|jgi:hypothetical protein
MKLTSWLQKLMSVGEPTDKQVGSQRKVTGRVFGKKYRELADGHRTTFVVGCCDMFEQMVFYALPANKPRMDKMAKYASRFESSSLRIQFDQYMAADPLTDNRFAAGCFLTFLNEKAMLTFEP